MLYVFILSKYPMFTTDDGGYDICHSYSVNADRFDSAVDQLAKLFADRYSDADFDHHRASIMQDLDAGRIEFVTPMPVIG